MIKKIAKIALLITGFLFIVSLVFGLVLLLNWPWWTGFFVPLSLLGLVIGFLFLDFVQHPIAFATFLLDVFIE